MISYWLRPFLKDSLCLWCMFNLAEDIDVQDNADAATDTAAEDSADIDISSNGQRSAAAALELKSSPVQQKSGSASKGPLKSIMKKREERAREKTQRKESDVATPAGLAAPKRGSHFKEFLELHVSKSPRHSVSMSSVVGAASGETLHAAADAGSVQTTAVRHGSTSRSATTTDADAAAAAAASRDSLRHPATDSPVDASATSDSSLQSAPDLQRGRLHEHDLTNAPVDDRLTSSTQL